MYDVSPADEQDKPKLRPASENPWYVLATLYGEQLGNDLDWSLNEKNRIIWNKYMMQFRENLNDNPFSRIEKTSLGPEFSSEHFVSLTCDELEFIKSEFAKRNLDVLPTLPIDFSNTFFDNGMILYGVYLRGPVSLHNIVCKHLICISNVMSSEIIISESIVDGSAYFQNILNGRCVFNSTKFKNTVSFIDSELDLVIENSIFDGHVNFGGSAEKGSRFHSATIKSNKFVASIEFGGCKFLGHTQFDCSVFADFVSFSGCYFDNVASFENVEWLGEPRFSDATFGSKSIFLNAKFYKGLDFSEVKFLATPPKFQGALLHENTQWHDTQWPPIPKARADVLEHIENYERLKQEMERLKKHEDEQFFFIKETQCREVRDGFPKNLPSKLYGFLSDYGTSVAKPAGFMLALVILTFSLLVWTGECPLREGRFCEPGTETQLLPIGKAMGLSLVSLLGFLPLKREIFGETGQAFSSFAHLVMGVEAVFGTILLFLLGLALRNRFRMR